MGQEQCPSERQKDCFCIFTIIAILIVRFFKTLFLSQSISKLFLIAHWDSLFYPLRLGQNFSTDPALLQQYLPYRFLVANLWRHGLPLWNSFSGLGMPLLADPQAFVFSPLDIIFTIFPSIHTWDLTLILELLIGALSTYLLARELAFKATAALIAALVFIFCPWVQCELELLGRGICLTPFVILFFVKLAKSNSTRSSVLAGIAVAIDILSSHPEMAFITVMTAVLLLFLIAYYNAPARFNFMANLRAVIVAGVVAFGLCAPMLIPFGEYLLNGDSYKINTIASVGLPLSSLVANYLFPFLAKGSLFFGPLSWLGLVATICFFSKSIACNRFTIPLIGCLGVSVIAVSRFEPFRFLFTLPPLSMTFGTYCLPEYILFFSLISGLGVSYLFSEKNKNKRIPQVIVSIIVLTLSIIPLVISFWTKNGILIQFDQTFDLPRFLFKQWAFNAGLVVIMLATWLITVQKSPRLKTLALLVFVALGITNLIITSYSSLPIRPSFKYPKQLLIELALKNDTRVFSIGDHLLKPGINLIYSLPALQILNPLLPRGYLDFVRACGGQVDQYTQTFPLVINRLIGLTGAHTILSMQPILDESILLNQFKLNNIGKSAEYAGGIKLNKMQLFSDAKTGAVFCHMQVAANTEQTANYHLCLSIENLNGKSVSYIEPVAVSISAINKDVYCSGFVPQNLLHWQVSLKVLRDKDLSFVRPLSVSYGTVREDGSWLLGENNQPELIAAINNDRFKLISNQQGICVYEDKKALPRQYFVDKIKWIKTPTQALTYMQQHADELNNLVVLDDKQKEQVYALVPDIEAIKLNKYDGVKRLQPDLSTPHFNLFPSFMLRTNTQKAALLVISDLYYPGWKISLDGMPWQMFRADYLMQATPIPAGKHLIKISYQPGSFMFGVFLFVLTLISLLVFSCLSVFADRRIIINKRRSF